MSSVSEAIRHHHPAFLKHNLLPRAIGEEQHLYPVVDGLVKAHGQATATMRVDHECIAAYIRHFAQYLSDTEQERVLEGMHAAYEGGQRHGDR